MSINKPVIGVLIIATRKYDVFVRPLLDSINKYFLIDYDIVVHVFEDKSIQYRSYDRIKIKHHIIPSYGFPFASLFRYKTFLSFRSEIKEDVVFYLDVDMLINDFVGEEVLPNGEGLVITKHPGFVNGGWGSNNTHEKSTSWLPAEQRNEYFCGGFNAGTREIFFKLSELANANIQKDLEIAEEIGYKENSGVLGEYHDETALNYVLKTNKELMANAKILSPAYCYPESWNISYEKKILALDKNHKEIRS